MGQSISHRLREPPPPTSFEPAKVSTYRSGAQYNKWIRPEFLQWKGVPDGYLWKF